jgi:hypothetical protein
MVPSKAKAPEQSGALLLRMRVRIVRTVARLPALPDTCAKQPRRNVTACPYPALIVIPIAPSVPSRSKLSRYGLASLEHAARLARRPTLTAPARDDVSEPAGRDEETGFEIEQRN